MRGIAPQRRIFEDNPIIAENNLLALRNQRRAVHNPAMRPNRHVAANRRRWRNIRGRMNIRAFLLMCKKHENLQIFKFKY